MVNKLISRFYLGLMFIFLYAPILVLIIFSFNESKSMGNWSGFSFRWYIELLNDSRMQEAFLYTVLVAFLSTIISTIVGTMTAIGIYHIGQKAKSFILNINYLPIINPDIVTAISLMILFSFLAFDFGFFTMLSAHILFSIPYVILAVLPRLYAMNSNITEAALDLGATPFQAVRKIILPEILPGIIAGALIAFTMSIDDFVISYFTTGNGVSNISIEIYSMARRGIKPTVNALASIMVVIVIFAVVLINKIIRKKESVR